MLDEFSELDDAFAAGETSALLESAARLLRSQERYHELFEILKLQARHRLGMPLRFAEDSHAYTASDQRLFEDQLLEACRDVGLSLLRTGKIQDGWFYLRHLGDHALVRSELEKIEVDSGNLEPMVSILLHEGLDTRRGFELVLRNYGTCNAITTMHNTLYGRSRKERQTAGRMLVCHVHGEVLTNVRSHIERQEHTLPASQILAELIADRPWLFADSNYHLDTSHISSTVQIAGELTDPESIALARDLSIYGQQLDPRLQYAGNPPFEEVYISHELYFAAQLGERVLEAIDYFRRLADATDAYYQGTHVIEVYIDLLARVGRTKEALEATLARLPAGTQTTGRAPSLWDLCSKLGEFSRFREICRERQDLLGYVISLSEPS